MSTVAKILVVLNLGLAVFFLASASNFLGQQDNFKTQLSAEKASHDTTRELKDTEIGELRTRIASANTQLNTVKAERDKATVESQRMTGEITHLREAYNQLSANATKGARAVDQLTNSLNAARDMISSLQTDNNQLRDNLKSAQDDRDAKVAQVNALQQQLGNETENRRNLETRLAGSQETIKRQDFQLRWWNGRFPGASASNQPAHSGQVLAADNKANVFVLSLGEEDGVKAGFTYIVSRGGEYIATVQITDVQAKQSAGRALKDISKGDVRRGDKAMNGQ